MSRKEELMELVRAFYPDDALQQAIWDRKLDNVSMEKRELYDLLLLSTRKFLPWGTLTGVRPMKLARKLLGESNREAAMMRLQTEYRVQPEKAALLMEIADVQQLASAGFSKDTYSLYAHIPFCPTRCHYCSFPALSLERGRDKVQPYVDSLCEEIHESLASMERRTLHSVYIGGGTPSVLTAEQLDLVTGAIPANGAEFTVECGRPETISEEKLAVLAKNGVSRVSVNPQSMNDRTLEVIGRAHTAREIRDAVRLVRNTKTFALNMDLIAGLPGEGLADMKETLLQVLALEPENITVHTLAQKKGSAWQSEKLGASEGEIRQMVELARELLTQAGYEPYYLYRQKHMVGNLENVGYTKHGYACVYNIAMMEQEQNILGVGLGATTQWLDPETGHMERAYNTKDMDAYLRGAGREKKWEALKRLREEE